MHRNSTATVKEEVTVRFWVTNRWTKRAEIYSRRTTELDDEYALINVFVSELLVPHMKTTGQRFPQECGITVFYSNSHRPPRGLTPEELTGHLLSC